MYPSKIKTTHLLLLLYVVVDRRPRQVTDLANVVAHRVVGERALGAGPHHVDLQDSGFFVD